MVLPLRYAVLLSFALSTLGATIPREVNPVVDLGYAMYAGSFNTTGSDNTHFFGVRYAASPAGMNRWTAPQPPEVMSGIQQANEFPPACISGGQGASSESPFSTRATQPESEDCLFLNVYHPNDFDPTRNLPVVVWIHGGGYASGSISQYDGDDILFESGHGAIVVTIQYRLGMLGFLAGTEVKENGVLNAGLLDQNFALQWVQDHIAKFGGDPTKVTIWGQSTGGADVIHHVVANDGMTSPPLFRAAMTSSASLLSLYPFNDTIPEGLFDEALDQTDCETLDCMRQVDVDTIQRADVAISNLGFFGTFSFVPVIDGTFITQRPIDALKQGKVNGDAVYTVTNANEGSTFVDPSIVATLDIDDFVQQWFPELGSDDIDTVVSQYSNLGTPLEQAVAIVGESIFICPTYHLLSAFSGRAFKAEFGLLPAAHGDDIPYYFTSFGTPHFQNNTFRFAFVESFQNFVIAQDPNIKFNPTNIVPMWEKWDSQGAVEMVFNKTEDDIPTVRPTKTSDVLIERCNLWAGLGASIGQ